MKGSLWKWIYVFCAMAGILTGYGVTTRVNSKEYQADTETNDNTLIPEIGAGVFFDEEKDEQPVLSATPLPTPTVVPGVTISPEVLPTKVPVLPEITAVPTVSVAMEIREEPKEETVDKLPSLGVQWVGNEVPDLPVPTAAPIAPEPPAEQTITYPAKIFGQVPVINRSDASVSYFEFAYDLIAMIEPVVSAKGINLNSLLTKFVVKALFCGVDIEKLDINAPIPRRLAALCLWLGAQVLQEEGYEVSAKSAELYVGDISHCSSSEKKAIAYLYENGIVKGFQVPGQRFYPEEALKTDTGNSWLSAVEQQWK